MSRIVSLLGQNYMVTYAKSSQQSVAFVGVSLAIQAPMVQKMETSESCEGIPERTPVIAHVSQPSRRSIASTSTFFRCSCFILQW